MSTRLFDLAEVIERTHLSRPVILRAIRQDYSPGEERRWPRLKAKAGPGVGNGVKYLIPEDALAEFIDQLKDA
ncbi:hypothetical protein [Arcanobacterium canis]